MINTVLIISPNFELEKCGVSDYVYELQNQYAIQGIHTFVLAMSDIYILQTIREKWLARIPFIFKSKNKIQISLSLIEHINPQKIIFNLVSYGYHKKGVPVYLLEFFKKINSNIPIIIIAHELWMGNFNTEKLKSKFLGFIQKNLIKRILVLSNVDKIFVTTSISKNILRNLSIESTVIQVFSNIPIVNDFQYRTLDNSVSFILFGSIAFPIDIQKTINFIKENYLNKNIPVVIYTVGIFRGYIKDWARVKNELIHFSVEFRDIGFVDSIVVSKIMQKCNFGLSSYMPEFWSKSGSIAAFIAHGLPIITISTELESNSLTHDTFIHQQIHTLTQLKINNPEFLIKAELDHNYNKNIFFQMDLL